MDGLGLHSCAHWLSYHCGIGLQAAREKVRVGRRLEELPSSPVRNDSAESLLPEARNADALVAMAHLALAAPADAAPAPVEIVVVDRAVLTGARHDGRGHLDGGVAIPPETARRLACDASVVALLEAADRRRFLHAHHIVHWVRGGRTDFVNLILLCSRHHRLVHEGGYRIETPADHVFASSIRPGGPSRRSPGRQRPRGRTSSAATMRQVSP